jgi:elongation factor P
MATSADIKKDVVLNYNNQLYVVTDFTFVNPGKGSAFYRTKMKSIESGKVIEITFKSGETVDIADVEKRKMQYLFKDAEGYHFMDPASYEQVSVSEEMVGDKGIYLKDGIDALVVLHNEAAITIEVPRKVTLKVVQAEPAVKGDTASGNVTKEVVMENGLRVRAPMFIKEGELLIINTDTGEYVERA